MDFPMKPIPQTKNPIVLRTDFSDDGAWSRLSATISSLISECGYLAYVDFVDDPSFADMTTENVLASIGKDHSFIVIADRTTFSVPDQPLLVMDLFNERGRTFRTLPTRIQSIENNLSIGNMGFEEFADSVDGDGVFRKFSGEKDDQYKISTTPRPPVRKKSSGPQTFLGRALFYTYKLLRGRPGA